MLKVGRPSEIISHWRPAPSCQCSIWNPLSCSISDYPDITQSYLIFNKDPVLWYSHPSFWAEILDFCSPYISVYQVWRTFCLICSNSLMRSPVPGYPIRLRLPELSSLALTNEFTTLPLTETPSIHPSIYIPIKIYLLR